MCLVAAVATAVADTEEAAAIGTARDCRILCWFIIEHVIGLAAIWFLNNNNISNNPLSLRNNFTVFLFTRTSI